MMKRIQWIMLAFSLFGITHLTSCTGRPGKPRLLIFTKTTGFRHSSIPVGKEALLKLAAENGYVADTTENADYFTDDSLKNYSAVIFLHTTGDLLNHYQEASFERYIQSGGGFVGIHAASDAEYDWGWYGRLVGGYFESHPAQQEAVLEVVKSDDPSTAHLPKLWKRKDEWYNFKKLNPEVTVLLKIDEKSYTGGKNGDNHPMAWYHEFDGGRAWYTELGHTEESFTETNYLKHLLGGIRYAIGNNRLLRYQHAATQLPPDEDRFTKVQLTQGEFFEPTEMTILPNLDVLVAQRRGEIMLYKNSTQAVKQAGFLNVYYKTINKQVNAEEGLLGIQADPDFASNHFVYVFYSPADTSVNRLSRFRFEQDTLDLSSEKIILQFYSQREICCHTGGSVAFGNNRELFLSTGDNSTPFDQPTKFANHGFAPLDDRLGFEQYDARRSSGNTNDLRGKILRIRINLDGSYSIPEGNLFPAGTAKARPEIYVMGNRNPYRIAVDKKRNYLYWGEVGPDSDADSLDTRGPRGYDELNQAKKAGFFGWPLFVGNNYPYYEYDYASGKTGTRFDPMKPLNRSRNNTGLEELPPVSPAFIWYPYKRSEEFPQMGTGGRNAMAGPTYYTSQYPQDTRLPEYFDGKVFIYDWMRNFIKLVTLDEKGDFYKMEPFMPSAKLSALIDLEAGPDGKLYLLEYGSGWFSKNPDAGLSRIDFNGGNRSPVISTIAVDKLSGALPYTFHAHIEARDPEKQPLSYTWILSNGVTRQTDGPELDYTLDKAGEYSLTVEVSDSKQSKVKSQPLTIYAGNETPEISIQLKGNQTYYFPGKGVDYAVSITDRDDAQASTHLDQLIVNADFQESIDAGQAKEGHQLISATMMGKNLLQTLDCKNCHLQDKRSIGPSFSEVALRYKKDPKADDYLTDKIIRGGGGIWGETPMAAHPNLDRGDAKLIVRWIRSLGEQGMARNWPPAGKLPANLIQPNKENGLLTITATYTDPGGKDIKRMTGTAYRILRNSKLNLSTVRKMNNFSSMTYNGMNLFISPVNSGWLAIPEADLTSITGVTLQTGWQKAPLYGYDFELRLDTPDGTLLAKSNLPGGLSSKGTNGATEVKFTWNPITDGKKHEVYLVATAKKGPEANLFAIRGIEFKSAN